jgi:hypothetical protein
MTHVERYIAKALQKAAPQLPWSDVGKDRWASLDVLPAFASHAKVCKLQVCTRTCPGDVPWTGKATPANTRFKFDAVLGPIRQLTSLVAPNPATEKLQTSVLEKTVGKACSRRLGVAAVARVSQDRSDGRSCQPVD